MLSALRCFSNACSLDSFRRGDALMSTRKSAAALGPTGFHDVGRGPGSTEGAYIDWLTISDRTRSVLDDVRRIRSHPLVPSRIPIYGYVYDVRSGRLIEVPEATAAGRAS